MTAQHITEEYGALPPEARRQVDEFVAFLRFKYAPAAPAPIGNLEDEPFIGMWRDRGEMEDSTGFVRELRRSEWGES